MSMRLSQNTLVYLNLALGLFVAIANGAALIVVLAGREEKLSGQALEISAWSIAGLLLAASAAYAIRRGDRVTDVLRWQAFLVIALIVGLTIWALLLLTGAASSSTRVVWMVGYLSVLALYCAVLGSHGFAEPRHANVRMLLTWGLVPACVVIDILTYVKLAE
jgi:hypothetical protein